MTRWSDCGGETTKTWSVNWSISECLAWEKGEKAGKVFLVPTKDTVRGLDTNLSGTYECCDVNRKILEKPISNHFRFYIS